MEKALALGILVFVLILIVAVAWRDPLVFFGLHIFSRTILDGFSSYTYQSVFAGMSLMQVYSISMILLMSIYLFSKRKEMQSLLPAVLPVSAIVLTYIMSGIVSNDWMPIVENSTKWIYMVLLAGLVVYILKLHELKKLIFILWLSLVPAVLIQFTAIISGDYIIASGGHAAYFGGYYHQNMLSYLLLAFMSCSLYLSLYNISSFSRLFYGFCGLYGVVALYLCGYRTTLIAMMAFLSISLFYYFKKENQPRRILAISITPLIIIFAVYFVGNDFFSKLGDIWVFLNSPSSYLDFSGHAAHTGLFSGRIAIINKLMAAYLSSPPEAMVAGMGIGSSQSIVGTYPHNEFVAALVEGGITGLIVLIIFVAYYLHLIFKNRHHIKLEESVIIGTGIGLIVMTIATMPFRDMRAMILFGLILGIMHYKNNNYIDRIF